MKQSLEDRAIELAQHIINTKATVRETAKKFNLSKSTVHKDVTERLKASSHFMWLLVSEILEQNKSDRAMRGGAATKRKYERLRGMSK